MVLSLSDIDRFWSKVDTSGSCWMWTASVSGNGYGKMGFGHAHLVPAHRVAWEVENGPIPDGMFVLHRCDVRRCVRPAHLFLGTKSDNSRDMMEKGRGNPMLVDGRLSRLGHSARYGMEDR